MTAGFNMNQAPAAVLVVVHESTKLRVVTFEPTPVYAVKARGDISGVVVLRIRFTAEGTVKVLGLILQCPLAT